MIEKKVLIKLDDNYTAVKTVKLSGELKGIVIQTTSKIDIEIRSILGYLIYKKLQYEGNQYIPIKVLSKDPKQIYSMQKDYGQYDNFYLNENVAVFMSGVHGNSTLIIFRLV